MALLQKGFEMAAGRLPKVIKPGLHAVLDYGVAASFFIAAAVLLKRNKRAAMGALLCGGATALNSALTDYPGGIYKIISYQTHGKIDAGLAGMAGTVPRFLAFADDSESKFFMTQALTETAITAMSDFDYYENRPSDRLRSREEQGVA